MLSLCVSISSINAIVSFADTDLTGVEDMQMQEAEGSLQPISLSLDGAYKQLESSKTIELVNLKKQSDLSISKGYSEAVSNYNKQEKEDTFVMGYDSSNKYVAQARRNFANLMIDANHQARLNSIGLEVFKKYHTIKNTEKQVEIAKESLQLKNNMLETTKRKYEVGSSSKREIEDAEKEVKDLEANVENLESNLKQLKENFNSYLGYDISQELILTDALEEIPMQEIDLEEAVQLALKNRNEMREADYNVEISQLNFNSYKAYPTSSSKYIKAKTQLLNAQIAKENRPTDIELDVKGKYNSMKESYNSVQTAKKALSSAEESLSAVTRKLDLGMVTSTQVKQAELAVKNAELTLDNCLLNYNIAVENYTLSMGAGTFAVNI